MFLINLKPPLLLSELFFFSFLFFSFLFFLQSHQTTNEFTLGQIVDVMYLGKDPFSGKVRLSRKALLPKPHNTMNHEDFVEKFLSPSKK